MSFNISQNDLKLISLFDEIAENTKKLIILKSIKIQLHKNDTLFRERDVVNNIFIILKGKVTIYKTTEEGQRRVIYILSDGQVINEVIFDGKTASISCEAFEDCSILSIPQEEMLKLMEIDFKLTKEMINSMSRKIRRLYRQLKNTSSLKVDKKVAAKLWKMSMDYGTPDSKGTRINLNVTITYLADMLGHSREAISRAMKQLEDEKLITYVNKKIIVDSEGLLKYYRGM